MDVAHIKLLTVIIGSEYKGVFRDLLPKLGAPGFTYSEVHGHGAHDPRISFLQGTNLQFQVLASAEITQKILEYLETNYLPNVPFIAYVLPVDGIPAGHFGERKPG